MSVISLTVVSINGKSIAPSIYGFETDDIVVPISNDGTYSTIVSRDVKGIDQQARSNAKYVYEVQEDLTTISSLSTDIFLVDVTYRKGTLPQYAVNYQRIFTVKMVSGVFTPVTLGTQFYVGEDGDPNLVFYQVSQTVAQIVAQTTPATGGSVTSVGLSMPSAFNVANTPITTAGVINVTGAGLDSQYIRGDGTLANFPTSIGGGASTSFYLNGGTNQGVFGGNTYYQMSPNAIVNVPVNFSINADGYVARFITDIGSPAQLNIPAGNWNFEMYFSASSSGGTPNFYVELYKYDTATTTFTLLASNSTNPEGITNGTVTDLYTTGLAVPATALTLTDRLAVRIYVNHSGKTITLHTQDGTLCQIITTFTTGLTALNGLTPQIQTFATGTSGTDFNINSAVSTHTFNLPIADSTHTGKLSSTDWVTFNNKLDDTSWIDYSALSTIIGWASFTTKELRYRVVGKQVFVHYSINGTSNSSQTQFSLPFVNDAFSIEHTNRAVSGGTNRYGFGVLGASSSIVTFYFWIGASTFSSVWATTNNKFIRGQFFYTIP